MDSEEKLDNKNGNIPDLEMLKLELVAIDARFNRNKRRKFVWPKVNPRIRRFSTEGELLITGNRTFRAADIPLDNGVIIYDLLQSTASNLKIRVCRFSPSGYRPRIDDKKRNTYKKTGR